MYARSSTFRGPPGSIDAAIEFVHSEVLPTMLVMDGCVGLSMLANHETRRCITVSAWNSLESRRDSATEVGDLRTRIGDLLGTPPEVDEWEIALLDRDHRSHEGARARLTWVQTDPAELDRLVDFTRTTTRPALDEVPGFCSASLVIDRSTGRAVDAVVLDDADAEVHSRETARSLREKLANGTRAEVLDVEQFDLVLAHLHAPELV